jgi:hypothetical protein
MIENTIYGPAIISSRHDLLTSREGNTDVPDADPQEIKWRTSTASNGTNCVEVAFTDHAVLVRDSANRSGAVLSLTQSTWRAFLTAVRDGQHDI